jgi:hypothetical protein
MMRGMMRYRLGIATAALLLGIAGNAWAAWTSGGYQDPATGLIWSGSYGRQTGSWWTWGTAQQKAADYVASDATGTYSDWRVPTVKELQTAIQDGTFGQLPLGPYGGTVYLWSSESRGNKGWAVSITVDANGAVVGGGQPVLFLKGSGFDVHFVRP